MIRLTLLLCAGIFVMLVVLGEDRGQRRAGLLAAGTGPLTASPVVDAAQVAAAPLNLPTLPVIRATTAAATVAEPVATPVSATVQDANQPAVDGGADVTAGKLRWIEATAVNVREGPSTDTAVLGKLGRGEAVLVVLEEGGGEGWSRVRIEGDGIEGFVASRFLTDIQP